jgi:uncharacterized Zn-binding protein involved in type VI secretion
MAWAADVPMQDCDGAPCINVQFGQGPVGTAVIDSGDVASLVDVADEKAAGFDGKAKAGSYDLAHPDVTIGSVVLKSVPTIGFKLKDDIAKGEMPHSQYLLAYPAFKGRIVQLDFIHHRVRISDVLAAPAGCSGTCAALSFPTFGKAGPPIIVADGFAVNGKPITVQVDTVYTGNLLIYSASIEKLGLTKEAQSPEIARFAFTDGGVNMKKSSAQSIAFAGHTIAQNASLYFPTPGVHEPDGMFDGTVGLVALQNKVVTFDFHDKTISIAAADG